MLTVENIRLVDTQTIEIEHWQRTGDCCKIEGTGDTLTIADAGIGRVVDELYADMLLETGAGGSDS
jgi:hypothetical protein